MVLGGREQALVGRRHADRDPGAVPLRSYAGRTSNGDIGLLAYDHGEKVGKCGKACYLKARSWDN